MKNEEYTLGEWLSLWYNTYKKPQSKNTSESAGKQTERSEKRGMGTSPHKQPRGEPKRARERRADEGGNVQKPAPPLNSQKKSRGNPSAKIERLRIKARQSSAGFVALGYAERQARRRALNQTPRRFAVPTSELLQLKTPGVMKVVERVVDIGLCPCFIFQS